MTERSCCLSESHRSLGATAPRTPRRTSPAGRRLLRHLVERGLKGVQLIISDACRGLTESAAEYLPEARWQRCMVHFYRNVFSHVPATKVREVSHMLKAIHAQESRDAADRKAARSSTTCAPPG